MTESELQKLRFPIGPFRCPETITMDHIKDWTSVLEYFPDRLEGLVAGLNDEQLDTVYRPDGWTVRQVVHHVADSHHHSYIRFKWALTEDKPTIKFYYEDRWAELNDSKYAPIINSINHLKSVHLKLVYLIKTLSESDLERSFIHPEYNEQVQLKKNVGIYAWHCDHHFAHIENLLKRNSW